jgi:acetoin utilization deacetylase AcuC-like enzyme
VNRTALITHPECGLHDPGQGHPENPGRLAAVLEALEAPTFAELRRLQAPLASEQQLLLAHRWQPPELRQAALSRPST